MTIKRPAYCPSCGSTEPTHIGAYCERCGYPLRPLDVDEEPAGTEDGA